MLDADRATALVMVITELVQNAIRHAFDPAEQRGRVVIRADRSARSLDIVVHDDGRGLPAGFSLDDSDRLGLQIVRTLVSAELDGTLQMHPAPGGGTDVLLRVPIGRRGGMKDARETRGAANGVPYPRTPCGSLSPAPTRSVSPRW